MKAKKKFPKTIYAAWEYQPKEDEPILLAGKTASEHAKQDEDVPVGIYQLVRVATVKNRSTLE